MADSAQTLKDLLDLDKKLVKFEAPTRKAFDLAMNNMKKAIDDESEDEIQFAQDDVDKAQDLINKCLHACEVLHGYTDELQKDREFVVQHREQIVKVVQHFGPLQKEFAKDAQELRKLGEQSHKAEASAQRGSAETEADLGKLRNFSAGLEYAVGEYNKARPKLDKDGRADPAGKTAEQARLKLIELRKVIDDLVGSTDEAVKDFNKNHPDVDASMKREVTAAADNVQRGKQSSGDARDLYMELLQLKQKAAAAKAPAPKPIVIPDADVKKLIAPIVGLDPKDAKAMAELIKLLKESQPDGWIGPLGKLAVKYKSKNTNGRAMAEQIVKLPVVKKQLPGN